MRTIEYSREYKNTIPDIQEVIDPLLYEESLDETERSAVAVNYDVKAQTTARLTIDGEVQEEFVWKSEVNPTRKKLKEIHTAFLQKGKDQGWIPKQWNAFFFTHTEGVEARKDYESKCLEGKVKANKRSWENKHSKFTGVSWDELQQKHPQLYDIQKETVVEDDEPVIKEEFDPEKHITLPAESVAAVSDIKPIEELREGEDVCEVRVALAEIEPVKIYSNTDFVRMEGTDGQEHKYYPVYVPELERDLLLEEGQTEIDGVLVNVNVVRD